ncbi:MAG: hypothetical protein IKR19_03110 [Acholeplasmatales bacterium]|nr:hypothetical protein [Acholeplasmatales bacterium]
MSEVKYAIRYFSREGSTRKLAEAIAEELGIIAYDVNEPLIDPVDVLFLGGAVYKNDLDIEFRTFIETLDAGLIKEAVVFSISSGKRMPYDVIKAILDEMGIQLNPKTYFCKGKTLFGNGGHPDIDDLKAVKIFARGIVREKEE